MSGYLHSQSFFNQIKGARLNGLANQAVTVKGSESWAINPSALGFEPQWSFSVNGESRFTGTGIRGSSISGSLPINKNSGLAIGGEFYGLPEYHQRSFGLGYGRLISNKLSIGSSFQYLQFFNTLNENRPLTLLTLGTLYVLSDQLSLGASFHLPFTSSGIEGYYAAPSFQIGSSYAVSDLVKIYTELDKMNDFGWNIKIAFEYQVINAFVLRIGVSTSPQLFSTGISLKLSPRIRVDIASLFYQRIGLTPSLSLVYTFESKKNKQE
ncbi:MAG: hypothetical protein ABI761_06880 [Saprospiraceae bacterium]